MDNSYLKNIFILLLSFLIVIPACSTPNTTSSVKSTIDNNKLLKDLNLLNKNTSSILSSNSFNTKGLYDINRTIAISIPYVIKTKVDYFITYSLPGGGSGGCKYDTQETNTLSSSSMSFQYYNREWYVNYRDTHIVSENGGSFSGQGYSGNLSVSGNSATIQVTDKQIFPDFSYVSDVRLWDSHADVCSRPSDVAYYHDVSNTSTTYEYNFQESFNFTPIPSSTPAPTSTPISNYTPNPNSSSSPSSYPSSSSFPTSSPSPDTCNSKSILPKDTANISNMPKSMLAPLEDNMNNSMDLLSFDKRVQKMTEDIKKMSEKLNSKGFSVQAFNPQLLRDQINQLKAQISQTQSDKQAKVNLINNNISTIQNINNNIINEYNNLTSSSANQEQYTFTDFNSFKLNAEDLKYEFDDYVSSENTYGLIEAAKIISKETSLYNKLVSAYSSGLLPEVIDNNDELPQYQDDETNYDKIQKPRQLIHWINNRIKSQTNKLEAKRINLDNEVTENQQKFVTQKDEYLVSLNDLENESENLSQLLDTLENDLGDDNFSTQGFNTKARDTVGIDKFHAVMEKRQKAIEEHRQFLRDNIPLIGFIVDQILDPINFVPIPGAKAVKTSGVIAKPMFEKFLGPLSRAAWDKIGEKKGYAYATNMYNKTADSLILMGKKSNNTKKASQAVNNISGKAKDLCLSFKCSSFRKNILSKINMPESTWNKIVDKHITGVIPDGTKFAPGTTRDQIEKAAKEIIEDGTKITYDLNRPEQVFQMKTKINNRFAKYNVSVNQNTGSISSVYPVGNKWK